MASSNFTMMRYLCDPKKALAQNLAVAVAQHIQRYGGPPTVAHVSKALQNVPERIGVIRIERAWGVFPNEIDLGIEPLETRGV